ncbi:hypothetical protein KCU61_g286, partial [Aureobasidium melanogenum]
LFSSSDLCVQARSQCQPKASSLATASSLSGDDTKDAAGAELLFGNLDASTGSRGASLENIGAAVRGSNKGNGVERSQRGSLLPPFLLFLSSSSSLSLRSLSSLSSSSSSSSPIIPRGLREDTGESGHGDPLGALLAVEKQLAAADILPPRLINTNDIGEILNYGTAEVESKVGAIVVATSRPRLVSSIFARFLGFLGQNDMYGVEVEEGARCWRADAAAPSATGRPNASRWYRMDECMAGRQLSSRNMVLNCSTVVQGLKDASRQAGPSFIIWGSDQFAGG